MKRKILKSERISLVLTEEMHLPYRVEWLNDPFVQATLNFDYPTSLDKTIAWFRKIVLDSTRVDFTIYCNEKNQPIGFGGFIKIDPITRKAELFIAIGNRDYWGGGYGGEAYKLLCNYGFIQLGLNRIYGFQLGHNDKAQKAILKLGWTVEGFLRDDIYSHGTLKGRYVVSILKGDWEKLDYYDL